MRLSLNKKYELAQKYYGFNKGIACWWLLRMFFWIQSFLILYIPFEMSFSYNEQSYLALLIWILIVVKQILFGYGLFFVKENGYVCVLISYISTPFIFIIFLSALAWSDNYLDTDIIPQTIITQIIYCIVGFYYFYNRKILFEIEGESIEEHTEYYSDNKPNSETDNSLLNTYQNDRTFIADIDFHTKPEDKNKVYKIVIGALVIVIIVLVLLLISALYYIQDLYSLIEALNQAIETLR